VVICTPQDIALMDASRAVKMYEQLNVPCLGIIENMSYYLCPQCGHRDELFDHGGAAEAAKKLEVPFLGEIPLNAKLRVYGDAGTHAGWRARGGSGGRRPQSRRNLAGRIRRVGISRAGGLLLGPAGTQATFFDDRGPERLHLIEVVAEIGRGPVRT